MAARFRGAVLGLELDHHQRRALRAGAWCVQIWQHFWCWLCRVMLMPGWVWVRTGSMQLSDGAIITIGACNTIALSLGHQIDGHQQNALPTPEYPTSASSVGHGSEGSFGLPGASSRPGAPSARGSQFSAMDPPGTPAPLPSSVHTAYSRPPTTPAPVPSSVHHGVHHGVHHQPIAPPGAPPPVPTQKPGTVSTGLGPPPRRTSPGRRAPAGGRAKPLGSGPPPTEPDGTEGISSDPRRTESLEALPPSLTTASLPTAAVLLQQPNSYTQGAAQSRSDRTLGPKYTSAAAASSAQELSASENVGRQQQIVTRQGQRQMSAMQGQRQIPARQALATEQLVVAKPEAAVHTSETGAGDFVESTAVHLDGRQTGPSEDVMQKLFAVLDRNGNRTISRAELIRATRTDEDVRELLGLPPVVSDADRGAFERVYQAMDVDANREVDFDEFSQFVLRLHEGSKSKTESKTEPHLDGSSVSDHGSDATEGVAARDGVGVDRQHIKQVRPPLAGSLYTAQRLVAMESAARQRLAAKEAASLRVKMAERALEVATNKAVEQQSPAAKALRLLEAPLAYKQQNTSTLGGLVQTSECLEYSESTATEDMDFLIKVRQQQEQLVRARHTALSTNMGMLMRLSAFEGRQRRTKVDNEVMANRLDPHATSSTKQGALVPLAQNSCRTQEAVHLDGRQTGPSEDVMQKLFAVLDRNGNRTISRAELIRATRTDEDVRELLGLPPVVSDADRGAFERVYQAMDVDANREVDFDEFSQFVLRLHEGSKSKTESKTEPHLDGSSVSGHGTDATEGVAARDGVGVDRHQLQQLVLLQSPGASPMMSPISGTEQLLLSDAHAVAGSAISAAELEVSKQFSQAEDFARRAELQSMKAGALRRRAAGAASEQDLEEADDADVPKAAYIRLITSLEPGFLSDDDDDEASLDSRQQTESDCDETSPLSSPAIKAEVTKAAVKATAHRGPVAGAHTRAHNKEEHVVSAKNTFAAATKANRMADAKEATKLLSIDELKARLSSSRPMPVLIDVRGDEYEFGHFKGPTVHSVPFIKGQGFLWPGGDMAACEHIADLVAANGVDHSVVFHCLMGQDRSPRAARKFLEWQREDSDSASASTSVHVLHGGFQSFFSAYKNDASYFESMDALIWGLPVPGRPPGATASTPIGPSTNGASHKPASQGTSDNLSTLDNGRSPGQSEAAGSLTVWQQPDKASRSGRQPDWGAGGGHGEGVHLQRHENGGLTSSEARTLAKKVPAHLAAPQDDCEEECSGELPDLDDSQLLSSSLATSSLLGKVATEVLPRVAELDGELAALAAQQAEVDAAVRMMTGTRSSPRSPVAVSQVLDRLQRQMQLTLDQQRVAMDRVDAVFDEHQLTIEKAITRNGGRPTGVPKSTRTRSKPSQRAKSPAPPLRRKIRAVDDFEGRVAETAVAARLEVLGNTVSLLEKAAAVLVRGSKN